jgi:hypothetical protein
MDMNSEKMSGEIVSKKTIGANMTGNGMPAKKKFPIGLLVPVAALVLFLGHFWTYLPVVRGIFSLFVFSKFLAGLSGTHFLL